MGRFPTSRAARSALAFALLAALAAGVAALAGRPERPRADFAFTCGGEARSLDPHAATGVPEGRVARLLFEGLVGRNPATSFREPAAASSWKTSDDKLTYTFELREDGRWSNGEPLVADDFVWSFRRILDRDTGSDYASALWCVEGAQEFTTSESPDWSRVGIRALGERTLEIQLARPTPYLLDLLAHHVFAPVHRASLERLQALHPSTWSVEWTRPENLVCNGPFHLVERRVAERLRFERNESYWDARHVAMRSVDVLTVENWNTALNLYLTGDLDWLDGTVPSHQVPALSKREDFHAFGYLGIYFYRVNTTKPPFDDKRVRQALAYSIQRRDLCGKVLKSGQRPAFTFAPGGHVGSYQSPTGFGESPVLARTLLAQAGFDPDDPAKRFPAVEIHFNTGESHRDVAEVIAEQWRKNLGIRTKLRNQEWKSFLDAQSRLDYEISRSSWIADYPDPSTFLDIWTTGHENNRTGWSHPAYDDFVRRAQKEDDPSRRLQLYQNAERILLSELPCIPIYAYVSQSVIAPRAGGFGRNVLDHQSPKHWFWRDDADLQRARAAAKSTGSRAAPHGPREGLYPREREAAK